jgi:hypothetical protein
MEVESSWTAVLKENGYPSRGRLTTNDYVKLLHPMFLDGYEQSLQSYPTFPAFTPFKGWDPQTAAKRAFFLHRNRGTVAFMHFLLPTRLAS